MGSTLVMALVKKFDEKTIEHPSLHGETSATYSVITNEDGRKLLQIDTYGSENRQIPGKISQSLQFGPEGIEELKKILSKF